MKQQKTFFWRGVDTKGKLISGQLIGINAKEIEFRLVQQGIEIREIDEVKASVKKIKFAEITLMTRQLATLLKSGIGLLKSLEIIAAGTKHKGLQQLIISMIEKINSGLAFAQVLRQYPKYFNSLYCSLVKIGEITGNLDAMLELVANYAEKTQKLKIRIKAALMYPVLILCFALMAIGGILYFMVPTFVEMFATYNAQLPAITQLVIDLSDWLIANWFKLLILVAILILGICLLFQKNIKFKYRVHYLLLKLPIFGKLIHKSLQAKWVRAASIMFLARIIVVDLLKVIEEASDNLVFAKATKQIRQDVINGQSLAIAMADSKIFDDMVVEFTVVGEQTGQLGEMLGKVAQVYEEQVDTMVTGLSTLIEPLIILLIGVLIGGIILAMYLPIVMLGFSL